MKIASIIICCYNSEKRIIPTLEHILNLEIPDNYELEVILVDNNSTDRTAEIARKIWNRNNPSMDLHIVHESNPGLSFARKAGVKACNGEVLIFCDDDNWLFKNYVSLAVKIMKDNPNVGVIGGRGIPETEIEPPYWFSWYSSYYAVGPQAEITGFISENRGYVYGAGSIFKKEALEELYKNEFTNLLDDRKKNTLISGGDNELCYNLIFLGYKIYYDENLYFKHFIPQARLTKEYLKSFRKGQAHAYDIVKSYESIILSKGFIRRNSRKRINDFRKIGRRLNQLVRNKFFRRIDPIHFIFDYYYFVNVLKIGLNKWNFHKSAEKEIFENFLKFSNRTTSRVG